MRKGIEMTLAAVRQNTEVTRPLKVLVPLIKEELEAGDSAGIEHYRHAGEMLLEAKEQVAHGEWKGWIDRNFHLSQSTAERYMKLAALPKLSARADFGSVREALREATGTKHTGKVSWQQPVQQIASRVNLEALAKERASAEREQQLLHKLGQQLIDIGYKVLSAKLHPDRPGGSTEAMSRLNKVRAILKEAI